MFDIQPHDIIVFTYVRYILEEVLFIFVRVKLSEGSLKLLYIHLQATVHIINAYLTA